MGSIKYPVNKNQEALHKNNQKTSSLDAIFKLKMHKNAFMARALPQTTPLGELLQHSPNLLAGLMKDRSWPTGWNQPPPLWKSGLLVNTAKSTGPKQVIMSRA